MNKDKFAFVLVIVILLGILGHSFFEEKELSENKAYGKAKIIDYYNVGGKKYIKYIFYVGKKRYFGEKRVYSFKCSNGSKGCVGEKFKVIYSSSDPENNEIDLGKYNKFRPTRVRFFNLN